MIRITTTVLTLLFSVVGSEAVAGTSVLFIGNSFTYGWGLRFGTIAHARSPI
jgi:hypothetical protein